MSPPRTSTPEPAVSSVRRGANGEVVLPADALAHLGLGASGQVEVLRGPGRALILRPRHKTVSEMLAEQGLVPCEDPAALRRANAPLTDAEREAVEAFLSE